MSKHGAGLGAQELGRRGLRARAPGLWSHRPIWCPGTGIMQDSPPPTPGPHHPRAPHQRRPGPCCDVQCVLWGREHGEGGWRSCAECGV